MELSEEEKIRYSRQIAIPSFGEEAQLKLRRAKVLVIGAGGLGSQVLLYLTAAGVGTIGIVENDKVDRTNLQRQLLYTSESVDKYKLNEAVNRLTLMNENVVFVKHSTRLLAKNALDILKDYDLVIDGSDNFPTRYLVSDACVLLNKPNVYGAIYRFEGQVAVFNYNGSATYRDLFPNPPAEDLAPNCATAGVLGVMAGTIGTLQAQEAIKIITSMGEPLIDQLLLFDALSTSFRKIKIFKNPNAEPITTLIDYDAFCTTVVSEEITFDELKTRCADTYELIDVRTEMEYQQNNIGGRLLPLAELASQIDELPKDKTLVLCCYSGQRSKQAIGLLQKHGFVKLLNLKGGLAGIHTKQ